MNEESEGLSARIVARVGDAPGIDGLLKMSRVKGRTTIDGKALAKAHPDIHERFTHTGAPSLRISLKDQDEE